MMYMNEIIMLHTLNCTVLYHSHISIKQEEKRMKILEDFCSDVGLGLHWSPRRLLAMPIDIWACHHWEGSSWCLRP